MKKLNITTTTFLWGIYILILMVLLPHTVWMFAQFEPVPTPIVIPYTDIVMKVSFVAVAAAIAFELGVGALTHKLVGHVNSTKISRNASEWTRLKVHYLNVYGVALSLFITVSAVANLTHAYNYAAEGVDFLANPTMKFAYVVLYGLTLPLTCAIFVAIIAKTQVIDEETVKISNKEVNKLKTDLKNSKQQVTRLQTLMQNGDAKVNRANVVLNNVGLLVNGSKTDVLRFLLVVNPKYTSAELVKLSGASKSLVSRVMNTNSTSES